MGRMSTLVLEIAGSVVGLFAGWLMLGWLFYYIIYWATNGWESEHGATALLAAIPSYLLGAAPGAAAGAFAVQRILRQKAPFWQALAGATAGLIVGGILAGGLLMLSNSLGMDWWQQDAEMLIAPAVTSIFVIAGTVIGSRWKAKPNQPPITGN
ncbi:MAG: hypothetical protein QUS33_10055 [Dehalococcoidia bacterium]|nr:hypothetical protein [Dehalococcoidia bacterium]